MKKRTCITWSQLFWICRIWIKDQNSWSNLWKWKKWLLLSFGVMAVETNFLKMWRFSLMLRLRVSIETTSREIETWKMMLLSFGVLTVETNFLKITRFFDCLDLLFETVSIKTVSMETTSWQIEAWKMVVIKLWGLNSWDQLFENMEIFLTVKIKSLHEDYVKANWDLKNGCY
jgi:hypothetical protein